MSVSPSESDRLNKRLFNLSGGVGERAERLRRVVEEEMRVLREKAQLLAEGIVVESYTAFLGLRVRPTIKQLWDAAPVHAKRAAKQALEAAILAYYLGGQANMPSHLYNAPPIVMNLNIVETRAEARAEIDLRPLVELLDKLIEELGIIRNLAKYPSATNMKAIEAKVNSLIKRLDTERRRLEQYMTN